MGSPSLLSSQPPPNPAHRELPSNGPATIAPLVLSNTANSRLTHCTYCVSPTAPLVSGGDASITNPYWPCPSPSKFRPMVAETGGRTCSWSAASATAYCGTGWMGLVGNTLNTRGEKG